MVRSIIADIVQIYIVILFARIISTWIPVNPWSQVGKFVRILARLTDPLLDPLRRIIRPIRVGMAAIDLAPLVLFIVLEIVVSRLR